LRRVFVFHLAHYAISFKFAGHDWEQKMPIYEYTCQHCGQTFEELLPQAAACRSCPDCGHPARHILSNTSFILKGGGWYETDYGKKKNPEPGDVKPDENAGASGGEGSDHKSEAVDKTLAADDLPKPIRNSEPHPPDSGKAEKNTAAGPTPHTPPPAKSAAGEKSSTGAAQ